MLTISELNNLVDYARATNKKELYNAPYFKTNAEVNEAKNAIDKALSMGDVSCIDRVIPVNTVQNKLIKMYVMKMRRN